LGSWNILFGLRESQSKWMVVIVIPGMESVNHTVEAVGTLSAWKTIGLVGAITAMRDKIDNVKTSGPVTVALVISLLGGTFAFGGIYSITKDTKTDTKERLERMAKAQDTNKTEINSQIAAIMENANANSALLANSFSSQLELSHKLFNSELEKRDAKLDIAYESANQGPRYTLAMAGEHESLDDARHYKMRERQQEQEHNCKETRDHVAELQEMCKETRATVANIKAQHVGVGYHSGGD